LSDAIQTVLTVVGAFLGVLLTTWGAVKVAKLASKAQLKGVEAEQDKIRAGAYTEARGAYRELTTDLRDEIGGLRKAIAEDRAAHRAEIEELRETHRQQIADLREERRQHDARLNKRIDELEERDRESQRRIDELEVRDDASQRQIVSLTAYIRQCISDMRRNNLTPPTAPPGVHFD